MKYNCEIIKDLIPLYCDDACSESSKTLVEAHTAECADCFDELKKMKTESVSAFVDSNEEKAKKKVIKNVKKKIILKRIIAVFIAVVITVAAGLFAVSKLIEQRPVEYYDGIADVYFNYDGNPVVKMYVDGYANAICRPGTIIENGEEKKIICMYVFSSIWDKFKNKGEVLEETWDLTYDSIWGREECDAIYYYIWDNPMFEEIPDFENKLKENGHLLWQAE